MHYEKFPDGSVKCIENEIPFELPQGWEWTRLGTIASIITGKLDANAQVEDGDYPFFTCGEEVFQTDTFSFDCDAVLLGGNNAVGDFKMHRFSGKFNAYQRVYVITAYGSLDTDYIYNHIQYYLPLLKKMSIGSQTRYLKLGMITELLISIPPLNVQKSLSSKIKELLNFGDEIEANKASLNKLLVDAKSKILDLAIRGKLVPQDPNDEPASVLLEHIRAEKEELIKQGKIKRDKKESVIFRGEDNSYYEKVGDTVTCIDEELPFDVPDSWGWVRLENCCSKEIKRGKSPKYTDVSNMLVFAQKCNTKNNGINIDLALYLDESVLSKYPKDEFMQDKDTVINSTGTGTLGRVGIYRQSDNRNNLPIVFDSHVTVIRAVHCIDADYIYIVLKAHQKNLEKLGEGSTNQKELKPATLKQLFIPLPPLKEQKRMVDLINSLYNELDQIEKILS